jgi:hypothetical protein
MYLRLSHAMPKINTIMKLQKGQFSILNKLTSNSQAYRMTKYDPTKELEVIRNYFIYLIRNIILKYTLMSLTTDNTKSQD